MTSPCKVNEDEEEGTTTICRICGDSSGCGVNFGCLSCESCKAFFRRCCARPRSQPHPSCPFAGVCRITKASRRACQACRLAKCVQEGMRKELVDAWKRARKCADQRSAEAKREKEPTNRRKGECKCRCGGPPKGVDAGTQTDLEGESRTGCWNGADQTLLDELLGANAVMEAPLQMSACASFGCSLALTLGDALRASDLAMRRMVEMFKQLAAFRALPPSDQLSLLRAGLIELLILRGAMAFDPIDKVWRHAVLATGGTGTGTPHPAILPFQLNFSVLPHNGGHYEEHKRFLFTFGEQWRTNRSVMLIMHAIVLFSARSDLFLVQRQSVEAIRERYCSLLKRYLHAETVRNNEAAYSHLMAKLGELGKLNASFQHIYQQIDQKEELEPLLSELFATAEKGK